MLAEAGDFAAAADLMAQALEIAPEWAAGWMMAGRFHLGADALGPAIEAWQRAATLDPAGTLGAQMHLAAHGVAEVKPEAQAAYVEALFDEYADRFEQELLQGLGYAVPARLAGLIEAEMERLGIGGFARGLDLGCGTGLMGERLRGSVSHLVGVDLSAAMVAETEAKAIYDGVEQGELLEFLRREGRVADIVTAADVFIYCASLPPILSAVSAVLRPGGIFAFSVERHDGEEAQMLQGSLRFAHNDQAVRRALLEGGLEVLTVSEETIRMDRGEPVTGLLFVAHKPVADAVSMLAFEAPGESESPILN